MNIFIDESGTFVNAPKVDSWNCVVAYGIPETDTRKLRSNLAALKRDSGFSSTSEVKLKNVTEHNYFKFLHELTNLKGILFCVATDAGRNSIDEIVVHRDTQVEKILDNIPRMHYQDGVDALKLLAKELSTLSPQLYVQLHSQVCLMYDFLNRGLLYVVQRYPNSLSKFRWRIDQKNTSKTTFEVAFEKVTPALLQSRSIREPMIRLEGADYSSLCDYVYAKGEVPTYLQEEYGIETLEESSLNIGKVLREDCKFEDSKTNEGVQVADLLASGIRRCLRNEFNNNKLAAKLLGGIMVQENKDKPPLLLLGFSEQELPNEGLLYDAVQLFSKNARPMVA